MIVSDREMIGDHDPFTLSLDRVNIVQSLFSRCQNVHTYLYFRTPDGFYYVNKISELNSIEGLPTYKTLDFLDS